MIKTYLPLIILFALAFASSSCEKTNDDNNDIIPVGKKTYYISNEGAFGYGNGSVSLYNPIEKTIINNAFKNVNNYGPGDVVQSIYKMDNKLFLMVNASNKIEITDTLLHEIDIISNLSLPRYMISISEHKAVVSCWGNGGVLKVINTLTNTIEDSIEVGNGPEKMIVNQGKLFVCNGGGFQSDSMVSVVNISNYSVQNIQVNDNPVDIVNAGNQSVWVLCQGRIIYDASWQPIGETKAALVELNPATNSVIQTIDLPAGTHPSQLEINPDKTKLYFGGGYSFNGIFTFDIKTASLSSLPLINKTFYAFNVEPLSGNLYCLEAPSFTSSGRLIIYTPEGSMITELKTGIGPNGIIF